MTTDELIQKQAATIKAQEEQITSLKSQLDWLNRQLFGSRSEQRLIDHARQGDLFAQMNIETPPPVVEKTETITYTRKPKSFDNAVNEAGLRFSDKVPVKTIHVTNPEIDAIPEDQREALSEKVVHRLAQRPVSYVVIKYVMPVVKDKATQTIINTQAPNNVLEKSVADVSFLAGMLVDKFQFHLPLNRQHQRLDAAGIELSRSTLLNLSKKAIALLEPIVDAQWQSILMSKTLAMDETPLKAGRKEKGKMRQAYLWPVFGENQEIVFHYTANRNHSLVAELLKGFEGTLLSDGYQAYSAFAKANEGVTHAECWAHTRRHFERACDADPKAQEALDIIAALYRHESIIREKNLSPEKTRTYRSTHSEPVVNAFFTWCEQQCYRNDLLPSNPLTKALKYARERITALKVFLGDPNVAIDTNHLERQIRPVAMGKRNWLFNWTELGAKHVGIIQSLLTTCKLHAINPYGYLVDVLQRVAIHPAKDIEQLTPRLWKENFADKPLRSDID